MQTYQYMADKLHNMS